MHLCDPEEARSYIADGAALDRCRMVHCFHEIQSCLSPMMMQGDNHMGKLLQLKYQLLKETKCKGKEKKKRTKKKE